MPETKLGKIKSVKFGFGGYQECEFGLYLDFGSTKDNWGVSTFISGGWSYEMGRSEYTNWTEEDRDKAHIDMMKKVTKILVDADVSSIDQLKNKPVEVIFDFNKLSDWRILSEVL